MMTRPQGPRSRIYDGAIYGWMMEPLLRGVYRKVSQQLPKGSSALDACCGTGGLSLFLADRCREVVGIDLSPSNIRFADRRRRRLGIDHIRYEIGDVSHLQYPDRRFDVACVTMALHEIPESSRLPVICELARVARKIFIVDFRIPMPRNLPGWRNRAIEFLAGYDHFNNFCNFSRRGGLNRLVEKAPVVVELDRPMDSGTLTLMRLNSSRT